MIFPPRWLVAEHTFRPPWFHRNVMSEFMGLVHGVYDAKAEGFVPGGASLHNCMSGARPRRGDVREGVDGRRSRRRRSTNTLAFMFETPLRDPADAASRSRSPQLQKRLSRLLAGAREAFHWANLEQIRSLRSE